MEKAVINDAFLITLFQILIDTPQMTATEVLERAREKGMLLAPTAGRLQAEFLGPLIEREIDLLARQGLLPRVPTILAEAATEYRIEYDSPMSRMQRAEKAAGFMRALDSAANYAKLTGDLEPLDFFNFDTATPEILDIQGAPIAWTRTIEEVEQRRATRTQNAQTQQMIDAAPAAASVMKSI
jgi:head-to-tail connecting protein